MYRQLVSPAELIGEGGHLFRLRAGGTAEPQRIANHDLLNLVSFDDFIKQREVGAPVLAANGLESLRGDAKRIGDRQTDGPRTDVEGEDAFFCWHSQDYRGWYITSE